MHTYICLYHTNMQHSVHNMWTICALYLDLLAGLMLYNEWCVCIVWVHSLVRESSFIPLAGGVSTQTTVGTTEATRLHQLNTPIHHYLKSLHTAKWYNPVLKLNWLDSTSYGKGGVWHLYTCQWQPLQALNMCQNWVHSHMAYVHNPRNVIAGDSAVFDLYQSSV